MYLDCSVDLRYYRFEILHNTLGDLPGDFFSQANLFFEQRGYNKHIQEWVDRFKKRREPYVLAKGILAKASRRGQNIVPSFCGLFKPVQFNYHQPYCGTKGQAEPTLYSYPRLKS